ncbi:MAG: hypothetical protein DMF81_12760 [Acidobacteria bacterium]|nr:MAG: hypothetical protein DMF81_12760 [Acidobacteriota bacterium]
MAWITFTGRFQEASLAPAFEEALRGFAGSWRVEISEDLVGGWWLLKLRRDDGFERAILLAPHEQLPERLGESVKEALRNIPARLVGSGALPPGVTRDRRRFPRR